MTFIGGPEFVRVPTFDNDHSVTETTKSIAASIQTSFLILWPSQSPQVATHKGDVSDETLNLRLAVDFENAEYINKC
jgi:hypothetical protein